MQILICPGMHPAELTEAFVSKVPLSVERCSIFPSDRQPVYSSQHILEFFQPSNSVLIVAFSAGVVGAIAAARIWHRQGIRIARLIAIDGWGVPLFGDFPIHRMSHDRFTHWSSLMLGGNATHFYADPAVEHLTLWHSPDAVRGVIESSNREMTAADFISELVLLE
ncbi:hypothetical protein ACQ4M3_16670 [Leptolyngbya sp. AN03gr2]|uniref:hypothetical protein n=1 Tax=unclassified Leptolyngbya TaxID=2650499 RepID=UPI003D3187B6